MERLTFGRRWTLKLLTGIDERRADKPNPS